MTTFKITFKHNVDDFYTATVEAESKEQAIEKFEDSPFDYLLEEDEEPFSADGNTLDIIETIEE